MRMPELTLEELASQVDYLRCAAMEAFTRGHSCLGDRLDEAAAEAERILARLQARRRDGEAIAEMYEHVGGDVSVFA